MSTKQRTPQRTVKRTKHDDLDFNLWRLIGQVRDLILEARGNELDQYGITHMQAATLLAIQSNGGSATQAQISKWLLRRPNTVSGILMRMQRDGLIKRSPDRSTKGTMRATLTAKGEEIYEKTTIRDSIKQIMSCLTEKEKLQIRSDLHKIRSKTLELIGLQRGYESGYARTVQIETDKESVLS